MIASLNYLLLVGRDILDRMEFRDRIVSANEDRCIPFLFTVRTCQAPGSPLAECTPSPLACQGLQCGRCNLLKLTPQTGSCIIQ